MSRTRKREYTKVAKRVCKACRNHGSCPHCQKGREYKHKKRKPIEDVTN